MKLNRGNLKITKFEGHGQLRIVYKYPVGWKYKAKGADLGGQIDQLMLPFTIYVNYDILNTGGD